jgi:acyl-CoA synthetase (AMP-forming)/AMP-acid ligase II
VQRRTLVAFEDTYAPYGLRPSALNPVYGMAEATLIVSGPDTTARWRSVSVDRDHLGDGQAVRLVADDDPQARPVVSCGSASPGISLRVADSAGVARPAGAVGEVQLTGPAVTRGYLGVPAAEQPFTPDGWLRTGDLGFLLDGELHLVGRLKDIITVRGQNYYAEDIEEIVRGLPAAGRRRIVAIPWDEDGAERMVVLWETPLAPEEAAATAAGLREDVVRRLGLDAVEVLPVPPKTIPTTTSGKVQRHATVRLHREQRRGVR